MSSRELDSNYWGSLPRERVRKLGGEGSRRFRRVVTARHSLKWESSELHGKTFLLENLSLLNKIDTLNFNVMAFGKLLFALKNFTM